MVEVLSKVSHLIRCANGRNRFTFGGVGWFAENNFVRGGVVGRDYYPTPWLACPDSEALPSMVLFRISDRRFF
jgi:hypothetical protein